jgi:2-polyprenyl-6-hydroxyphenyl methylase/3-demethylubiquinone-9 3-methyltransferase
LANIRAGQTALEIGCAPGEWLALLARAAGAEVSGLDYAAEGVELTRSLFHALGIVGDLRCEDAFASSFAKAYFDVVYSLGVIEHFEDPSQIVRIHLELTKPGGITLIAIPNYTGFYERLQRYFYPENLTIHNLSIMSKPGLEQLVPRDMVSHFSVYKAGHFNPGMISFYRKWPKLASRLTFHSLNLLGHIQPMTIPSLCPIWVLLMQRHP